MERAELLVRCDEVRLGVAIEMGLLIEYYAPILLKLSFKFGDQLFLVFEVAEMFILTHSHFNILLSVFSESHTVNFKKKTSNEQQIADPGTLLPSY